MQKMRKAQFEFGWLFALIIGAMILFMAVFFAGKIFKTGTYLTETEILRNFDIILNPFSSVGSIASLTLSKPVEMPYQTELKIGCIESGTNQGQEIMLRQFEKGRAGEWTSYTIRNKYIFAPSNLSGKTFWVFSKPLELPWRVDDLIYMISEDYCFIGAPSNIQDELNRINASKIHLDDCTANMKEVCFYPTSCNDIQVNYASKTVSKIAEPNYYFADDATMYAAIFSDKKIYDCNMQRILSRLKIQAEIYSAWASSLTGCVNNMLPVTLSALSTDIDNAKAHPYTTPNLASRASYAESLDSYDCPIIKK